MYFFEKEFKVLYFFEIFPYIVILYYYCYVFITVVAIVMMER